MANPATHLIVMGVSGSGKTTIAQALESKLGYTYAEADEFHPQSNIDKMSQGIPLTDEDRWPWLRSIRDWMSAEAEAGRSTVVTCSALKRSYRDLLREAEGTVFFIHLDGSEDLLRERMQHRSGHFMPASLLPSQLATLQPLESDEPGLKISVEKTPDEIVSEVLHLVKTHQLSTQGAADHAAEGSPETTAQEDAQ